MGYFQCMTGSKGRGPMRKKGVRKLRLCVRRSWMTTKESSVYHFLLVVILQTSKNFEKLKYCVLHNVLKTLLNTR